MKKILVIVFLVLFISGCSNLNTTDYTITKSIINEKIPNLNNTYLNNSAFVCVYNNGTLFASENLCP